MASTGDGAGQSGDSTGEQNARDSLLRRLRRSFTTFLGGESSYRRSHREVLAAEIEQLCQRHAIRELGLRPKDPEDRAREAAAPAARALDMDEERDSAEADGDFTVEVRLPQPGWDWLPSGGLPYKDTDPERRRGNLSGLALSGGGIRSAAFNCGVMESLARAGRLESFDYLSSVSGGGYAGTALTWAVHSNQDFGANDFHRFAVAADQDGGAEKPEPGRQQRNRMILLVDHIRRRANYLAPNDDISLLAGLANTLRMSLTSFGIYAAMILGGLTPLVWFYLQSAQKVCRPAFSIPDSSPMAAIADFLAFLAAHFGDPCLAGISIMLIAVIIALYLLMIAGYVALSALGTSLEDSYASRLAVLRRFTGTSRRMLFALAFLLLPVLHSYRLDISGNPLFYGSAGVSLLSSAVSFGLSVLPRLSERTCALLRRLATFLLFFVLLLLAFAASLAIARAIEGTWFSVYRTSLAALAQVAILALGFAVSHFVLKSTSRLSTRRAHARSGIIADWLELAAKIFAVIVVAMGAEHLLAALSEAALPGWLGGIRLAAAGAIILLVCQRLNPNQISSHSFYRDRLMEAFMPTADSSAYRRADRTQLCDIYDMAARMPLSGSPILRGQDLMLHEEAVQRAQYPIRAPYPIINTNVILVRSKKAKYYQRGGDSFMLSPLFCGSTATGWIATRDHSVAHLQREPALTLATAMAISGAAANPNTSGDDDIGTKRWSISFLMTLFNIRLGFWQPNPVWVTRRKGHTTRPPNFIRPGLLSLVSQYFDEKQDYIELSDGGHFDNTGLYELFRRRVRDIVVSDASADPDYSLDDLARVLALAAVDFGVSARFHGLSAAESADVWTRLPQHPATPRTYLGKGLPEISDGVRAKLLRDGYVTADIFYERSPGRAALRGTLVYLKPALITDAPVDLLSYALNHPDFPHQATSDQFFSERRFESYRRLGYVIGQRMCETVLA